MTIIAYRDGIMAADSLVTENGSRIGFTRKLARTPDGAIGGATSAGDGNARFLDWLTEGCSDEFDPRSDADWFAALIVDQDGTVWHMDSRGRMLQLVADFVAEGSGRDLAMGAMAMGATAEQAVEIASRFDIKCGGPVQVEHIHPNRVRPV